MTCICNWHRGCSYRLLLLIVVFLSLPISDVSAEDHITVLRDEFETLPTGPLSKVLWARAEYHYLPESGPKGPWSISCYSSALGSQRAWKVIEHAGRNTLQQNYTPGKSDSHVHPMVVAGDPLWENYILDVSFSSSVPRPPQRRDVSNPQRSMLLLLWRRRRSGCLEDGAGRNQFPDAV